MIIITNIIIIIITIIMHTRAVIKLEIFPDKRNG